VGQKVGYGEGGERVVGRGSGLRGGVRKGRREGGSVAQEVGYGEGGERGVGRGSGLRDGVGRGRRDGGRRLSGTGPSMEQLRIKPEILQNNPEL